MPKQYLTDSANYMDMACHVFALSGDPAQQEDVNNRYAQLGNLLTSDLLGVPPVTANNNIAPGLRVVTNNEIRQCLRGAAVPPSRSLRLLCREFGLVPTPGTRIKLWGHFEPGQRLPEHMYVTTADGMIYDTVPGAPIRRDTNNNGQNPPSWISGLLDPGVIFSIEVAAFAPQTQAVVNRPGNQWANI
ncbi:hypothetical protein [Azospirillum brasilense]|uniref:hypothetical protein n=1 Tax=Azospirillum brasilense TaxID=192 RepID=UPI000E683FF0|nr:hypothetical protein [Azospirillum brasilense]NUB29464.1 hypothetical protein [Azospirillum brasilense]NUB31706.1 hypothetical protein [Azospirillum brasilense]RIW05896.1 hypothetical protein D2T81_06550 [Azospirillum brasilense]